MSWTIQDGSLPAVRPGTQADGSPSHRTGKGRIPSLKGRCAVILELAADAGQVRGAVDAAVKEFASRGFRSLGVARTKEGGQWQFLGVCRCSILHGKFKTDNCDSFTDGVR